MYNFQTSRRDKMNFFKQIVNPKESEKKREKISTEKVRQIGGLK